MIRILLALAAATTAAAAAPPPAPITHAEITVPRANGPQQVVVQTREFPKGASSGWHVHNGTEVAYLVSGEMEFRVAGNPVQRQHPGESITIPRGIAHMGTSVGNEPARLVITLVVDKGKPLRVAVPVPKTMPAPKGQ